MAENRLIIHDQMSEKGQFVYLGESSSTSCMILITGLKVSGVQVVFHQ